jgi:hypothetical protein
MGDDPLHWTYLPLLDRKHLLYRTANIYVSDCIYHNFSLAFEVIMGVIIIACEVLELIIAFFAAIDFKSLEKAQ